jgi:hypothetical protein
MLALKFQKIYLLLQTMNPYSDGIPVVTHASLEVSEDIPVATDDESVFR